MKPLRGFTLIELLVFIAIFSVSVVSLITILVLVTQVQSRQSGFSDVNTQGQFLLQQLQYYIENARVVDMAQDSTSSVLRLRETVLSQDPTYVTLATGTVYLQQGSSGTLQALTSNKVTASALSFTRHYNVNTSSAPYGTDSVSFSFAISAQGANGTQYSQIFQSSAAVLAPVGEIALVQQAKAENNSASVSSLAASYTTSNATGSLLLGFAIAQGSTTVSLSDSQSNTWVGVATTSHSPLGMSGGLFEVTSAKNGTNTVTVTFGAGAGYAALNIYEYRGPSPFSLDTSTFSAPAYTLTPGSGAITPTSSVELLFSVGAGGAGTTASAPPPGFTIESTSTLNNQTQVFIADMEQYITGAVSTTWTLAGNATTSIFLGAFK